MKKLVTAWLIALALAISALGAGWAAEPPAIEPRLTSRTQETCPVLGNKINKDLYVDYNGQRVYFCCPQCLTVFQKNPEKYLQKMREQGVNPEPIPGGK